MEEKVLLRNAELYHPFLIGEVIDCRLDGPSALLIRVNDMVDWRVYLYDDFDQSLMELPRDCYRLTDEECRMEFARRLRRAMLVYGTNQRELSARTGISSVMLSRYMSGRTEPGFCNVDRIAKALGCSIDVFSYRY